MLSIVQKADILRKSGVDLPACPEASSAWASLVESLFVDYVAARAAKSLRDAEEVRQLDLLRRMSTRAWRNASAEFA